MPGIVWKGYLSFGLVSIPIKLLAAARSETIHFHMLHKKDLSRIKEVWYCAEENEPVERADIVKGYEINKGEYVVVEDAELKAIAPPTATAMEILQFVRISEVDPLFLETSYYVAPDGAGSKPYALLLEAMTETKYDAVAKVTMHSREHIVIIRPTKNGMVLHTMYFVDELHSAKQAAPPKGERSAAKELDLAKRLIESLASPFKPEQYEDEYRKNVERLLEEKHQGKKPTTVKQPKVAKVTNILEALQKSLQSSSKSAASSPATGKRTQAKARKKTATKRSRKVA